MKKILSVLICLILVAGFTACQKSEPTTSPAESSTSQQYTIGSTTQTTTESTTKAQDISFIYGGYWYEAHSNYVCAFKFDKDGTATKSIYRRHTLTSSNDKPDQTISFTYKVSGSALYLEPKNADEDEATNYIVDYSKSSLTLNKDDPESTSSIVLKNKSNLSVSQAKDLWLPAN